MVSGIFHPSAKDERQAPQLPFHELKHVAIFGSAPACGPLDYGRTAAHARESRTPSSRAPGVRSSATRLHYALHAACCMTRASSCVAEASFVLGAKVHSCIPSGLGLGC